MSVEKDYKIVVRQYSQVSHIGSIFLLVMLLLGSGCNTSRYGVHYDRCLPEIQRVGVIAPSVKVYSLHTGGVQEERPDLEEAVRQQAVAAVRSEISRCKRFSIALDTHPTTSNPAQVENTSEYAMLTAVSESIITHHYQYGHEKIIDYSTGDAPQRLGRNDVEALLCVGVCGVVPTAGREALQTTALVMGVMTGIYVTVPTKGTTLAVMLVDCRSGEVLWFNTASDEIKVTDGHDLQELCKDACRYLFKPSK